jgi:pyruvate dehydrogenase E2 component (dihydrolipoamide acetyltransferase)
MMALSPTMSEGTITRWKVAEGEAFKAGALLCEVETDKASMDYEAPKDSVLLKIIVAEGGKATVGEPIAVIGAAGEDPGPLQVSTKSEAAQPVATTGLPTAPSMPSLAAAPAAATAAPATAAPATAVPASDSSAPSLPASAFQAPAYPSSYPPSSPLARILARELGLDLRGVRGSGPGGRVVERDFRAIAATGLGATPGQGAGSGQQSPAKALASGASPAEDRRLPVSGKRAVIARRLSESFFTAPHFYLKRRAEAGALLALREASRAGREKPISLNALLVKLSAEAIVRHPYVNSSWAGDAILERSSIDIGLAVALDDGLVTPVVRDCAHKGAAAIEEELSALIAKAKGRGLAPSEYEGAGFTITNLGGFGIEEFTAIINPPGSAILAVGAALDEPFVRPDGSLGARRAMALTLGCDHRVIDGAAGARFLATLVGFVEDPGAALL